MARLLRIFVFACVVVLPCAVLVTEIVLYSQNSLYLNDRWIVQKRMMEMGVMGADEFLLTRTLLAQNLLNLGSYHGYQEVIYRQPVTLGQIEFRFQVEDGSYLVSVAKLATDCEIEDFHFLVDMHVCYMAHMHHATWN